jgi:hypothetical protein
LEIRALHEFGTGRRGGEVVGTNVE